MKMNDVEQDRDQALCVLHHRPITWKHLLEQMEGKLDDRTRYLLIHHDLHHYLNLKALCDKRRMKLVLISMPPQTREPHLKQLQSQMDRWCDAHSVQAVHLLVQQ